MSQYQPRQWVGLVGLNPLPAQAGGTDKPYLQWVIELKPVSELTHFWARLKSKHGIV